MPKTIKQTRTKALQMKIDWIRDPPPPLGEILNRQIAQQVIKELDRRIQFLNNVNAAIQVQRREVEQKLSRMQ